MISPGWLHSLMRTDRDTGAAILRWTLAIVFFPHGAQKMLGWFGGPGFTGEVSILTEMVGLPAIIAVLVIFAEFFGALGLAVGLLGRVAAFGIASVMVGAILTQHLRFGFFMNWTGTQGGEGFEYHLLVLAMTLVIMIKGSGAASLDRALTAGGVRKHEIPRNGVLR